MCDHEGKTVKITDFNVSKFCSALEKFQSKQQSEIDIKMWTSTGTLLFKSPEMLQEFAEYNQTVDMWSAGVTLFIMLSNTHPFYSEYPEDIVNKILNVNYNFSNESWKEISNLAKDLIRKCLVKDPNQRILPTEALNHPWILNNHSSKQYMLTNQQIRFPKRTQSFVNKQGSEKCQFTNKSDNFNQEKQNKTIIRQNSVNSILKFSKDFSEENLYEIGYEDNLEYENSEKSCESIDELKQKIIQNQDL